MSAPACTSRGWHRALALLATFVLGAAVPTASGQSSDARYRAGLGLLQRGMHADAATELQAFLSNAAPSEEVSIARYALAVCLLESERTDEAIAELDRVVSAAPCAYTADAALLRGQCAIDAGNIAAALPLLERVHREYPEFPRRAFAQVLRGECLSRLGKHAEAIVALRSVETSNAASPGATDPSLVSRALWVRGVSLAALGQDDEAIVAFRAAFHAQPNGTFAGSSLLAEAQALHRLDRFEDAIMRYDEAVAAKASNGDRIALWAAACESRAGRDLAAAERLQLAIAAFPDSASGRDLLYEHAAALHRAFPPSGTPVQPSDRDEEKVIAAIDLFLATASPEAGDSSPPPIEADNKPAIAADPRLETLRLLRAERALARGNHERAEAAYAEFLRFHGEGAAARRARARRGLALAALHRDDEARSMLVAALDSTATERGTLDDGLSLAATSTLLDLEVRAEAWENVIRSARQFAALAHSPDDAAAGLLRVVIACQRLGRYNEAIDAADKILHDYRASPSAARAAFERGQALVALGRIDDARAALEALLDPAREEILGAEERAILRAQVTTIALRQGRADDAATWLATGLDPEFAHGAAVDLGALYASLHRHEDAVRVLQQATRDAPPTATRRSEGMARLALALLRTGAKAEARAVLQPALDDPKLDPSFRGLLQFEVARLAMEEGDAPRARAAWTAILQDDAAPSLHAHAALALAEGDVATSRWADALSWLDRAERAARSADDPQRPLLDERIAYFRGAALLRTARYDEAVRSLTVLTTERSTSEFAPTARMLLGEALIGSHRPRDAAREFAIVAAGSAPELVEPALLRLGEALAAGDDPQASEEAFARHRAQFPDSKLWYQARFGEGLARERQGRYEAAIACYQDVVSRHQGVTAARAQFQIGECLFAVKRLDDAIREFVKVDVLFAEPAWSAAALYEAGQCLRALQRRPEAMRHFESVMTRFPDSEWSTLARERKRELESEAAPASEAPALPGRG